MSNIYEQCLKVKTQEEADEMMETFIQKSIEAKQAVGETITREEAVELVKSNIGYFGGYCDRKDQIRIEELFDCVHPVFGKTGERQEPSAMEAFAAGQKMAEDLKNGIKPKYFPQPKEKDKPKSFRFGNWLGDK